VLRPDAYAVASSTAHSQADNLDSTIVIRLDGFYMGCDSRGYLLSGQSVADGEEREERSCLALRSWILAGNQMPVRLPSPLDGGTRRLRTAIKRGLKSGSK